MFKTKHKLWLLLLNICQAILWNFICAFIILTAGNHWKHTVSFEKTSRACSRIFFYKCFKLNLMGTNCQTCLCDTILSIEFWARCTVLNQICRVNIWIACFLICTLSNSSNLFLMFGIIAYFILKLALFVCGKNLGPSLILSYLSSFIKRKSSNV